MASETRVVIDRAAVRSLLRGGAARQAVSKRADAIAARANSMCSGDDMTSAPFEAHVGETEFSAVASVVAKTQHGAYAQAKRKVLSKAARSGA